MWCRVSPGNACGFVGRKDETPHVFRHAASDGPKEAVAACLRERRLGRSPLVARLHDRQGLRRPCIFAAAPARWSVERFRSRLEWERI
jgi:hypothetical protein